MTETIRYLAARINQLEIEVSELRGKVRENAVDKQYKCLSSYTPQFDKPTGFVADRCKVSVDHVRQRYQVNQSYVEGRY